MLTRWRKATPYLQLKWFAFAGYGLLLVLLVALFLPETHPPEHRVPLHLGPLFASLWAVWCNPHGRRLALTAMVNFAGMFLYISSAPYIVVSMLHMGEQDFWVLFVPLISGMVIGSSFSGRLAGRVKGARLATVGYWISLGGGAANLSLMLVPAAQALPWAVMLLPVYTFGVAMAFPILTLAMLDLFPANRGAAASVQSFVSLVANALIAGVLAPLVAVSLPALAATALLLTVVGYLQWRRHLQVTALQPPSPPGMVPPPADGL